MSIKENGREAEATINEILKARLKPSKDFIFGFADLRNIPLNNFSFYSFGISIGRRLQDNIIDKLVDGPTIEYFTYYKEINDELSLITGKIQSDLSSFGIDSFPVKPTISLNAESSKKYLETLTYDISHKMIATRAGLGWIGKTDLLISKAFGPRLRLVSILLNQDPGTKSVPIVKSRCGKCNLCVEKCPAGAANGKSWDINTHRDKFFDPFKCRNMCGELAKQRLDVEEHICGLCVNVCPFGKNKNCN